jgi:hypothetical protein
MKALIKRIGRLEDTAAVGKHRFQCFHVTGGSKGDDVHAFLRSVRNDVGPDAFVIHFIGMPEDDAGPLVDVTPESGSEAPSRKGPPSG